MGGCAWVSLQKLDHPQKDGPEVARELKKKQLHNGGPKDNIIKQIWTKKRRKAEISSRTRPEGKIELWVRKTKKNSKKDV